MSISSSVTGLYFTGDGAYRDKDGHYQITGRVDDVINIKGRRLGTAEVESALVSSEVVKYNAWYTSLYHVRLLGQVVAFPCV